MLRSLSGFSPMSAKKFSNFLHRVQTVIPRPPYRANRLFFSFVHRSIIRAQELYVLEVLPDVECPCLNAVADAISRCSHPHESVDPLVRCDPRTVFRFPQSQRHSHITEPLLLRPFCRSTSKRPNCFPVRSFTLSTCHISNLLDQPTAALSLRPRKADLKSERVRLGGHFHLHLRVVHVDTLASLHVMHFE